MNTWGKERSNINIYIIVYVFVIIINNYNGVHGSRCTGAPKPNAQPNLNHIYTSAPTFSLLLGPLHSIRWMGRRSQLGDAFHEMHAARSVRQVSCASKGGVRLAPLRRPLRSPVRCRTPPSATARPGAAATRSPGSSRNAATPL